MQGTTYRVSFTRRANLDLDAILRYVDAISSVAAHRWFNGLLAATQSLTAEPQRSPKTAEDPTLYQLLYGNKPHIYRIIYKIDITAREVNILHIRHRARSSMSLS